MIIDREEWERRRSAKRRARFVAETIARVHREILAIECTFGSGRIGIAPASAPANGPDLDGAA